MQYIPMHQCFYANSYIPVCMCMHVSKGGGGVVSNISMCTHPHKLCNTGNKLEHKIKHYNALQRTQKKKILTPAPPLLHHNSPLHYATRPRNNGEHSPI